MQLVWEGSSHHIAAIKQINTAVTKVLAISDFCIIWVAEQCLQCFDAVGWAAGRASGL